MSVTLAIDFGTSRTKLAYLNPTSGQPELMRLGQRDDPFIPSLFYLERDSDQIFIGDDAEAMLADDPAGVVDVLKRKLHETHVRANRRRVTPQALLTRLLADLRERAGREIPAMRGQLAQSLYLTVPAIRSPMQDRLLREAAERAGFTDVTLIAEPVAAAQAWLAHADTTADGVVVFDCGGGTIDWAYLRREGEAFRLVAECPPGGDHVGGYDLDRELLSRIQDQVEDDTLDGWSKHQTEALHRIRVVKERYCRNLPLTPIRIAGRDWHLTGNDIERVITERFVHHACEGLKGYLDQVREVNKSSLPPVLLVGGSSRLKGLRETIEHECECETAWWDRADYATVLGGILSRKQKKLNNQNPGKQTFTENQNNFFNQEPEKETEEMLGITSKVEIEITHAIQIDCHKGNEALQSYLRNHAVKRIKEWQAAAETGLPGAQWLLGMCLSLGAGIDQNDIKAIHFFREAATQDYTPACLSLGTMYLEGRGVSRDASIAVEWIFKAAKKGYAPAQFYLGVMYRAGRGVVLDYSEGVDWYYKAAKQGHMMAQRNLEEITGEKIKSDKRENQSYPHNQPISTLTATNPSALQEVRSISSVPPVQDLHGQPVDVVQRLQRETAEALGLPVIFRHRRLRDGGQGPEMLVIPPGQFLMGSPENEPERFDDEGPQHPVTIAQPFAIGRFTVTFEEYDRFCTKTGRDKPDDAGWGRRRQPAIYVSWDDAVAYCAWLSQQTGRTYRLPSEAEWEYAARAGTNMAYWWGSNIDPSLANYDGSSSAPKQTLPVDCFQPNPFGLYQVHGNVWEWCQDRWHGRYAGAPTYGTPWEAGSDVSRVVRGGSYSSSPWSCRAAYRSHGSADSRFVIRGFRVCCDIPIIYHKATKQGDADSQTTPSLIGGRYRDNSDGTVTDVETGLQWMGCSLGQEWKDGTCVGTAEKFTWEKAMEAAEALNRRGGYAGYRDWRLPTKDELRTLVYCSSGQPDTWNNTVKPCKGKYDHPTINQSAFPNTPAFWFWSSSSYAGDPNAAWGLDLHDGYVLGHHKYGDGHVRLMRGGQ